MRRDEFFFLAIFIPFFSAVALVGCSLLFFSIVLTAVYGR